ncbi:protein BREAST CANCER SUSCEPTIBILITY 1 homolog isoform X2 [Elaeis guineensis]|uniref:Protein BREAST CANCER SUSCEPTIBILITY 1 homolog isoform X2 n=1 Tax=Elaeis guineensis var. tenera TaxID=51953 RepID=A0A6J0PK14_ELAGV|nr:protein BREAST CANCER SUSCEPTIBILITY 1 homolog isoform X2 [Elaeis guineensis]
MADLGHLEKMGRELKCPICLSLLSSAVSLSCNHVFCNSCILASMKLIADCPVCKVPFRRREVCPAPQMDNLVSIFKCMEAAAGTNIFSTQLAPSAKNSDGLTAGNHDKNSSSAETAVAHQGKSMKEGLSRKMQKDNEKSVARNSYGQPSKMPSFPAKKRVRVTPYPVSETPARPDKASGLRDSSIELNDSKEINKSEKLAMEEQFSPFFWLREEEDNKTPEKPSGQQTADTPPPYNVPCFSDIKDSDYESPVKLTPTGELQSKPNAVIAFDSEMFEWTQRDCSPELCSTPIKTQTAGRYRLDAVQEKECQNDLEVGIASSIGVPYENVEIGTVDMKNRRKNNKIQTRHAKLSVPRSRCKVCNDANKESPTDAVEVAQNSSQENEETDKRSRAFARKILKQCSDPDSHQQTKHLRIATDLLNNSATTARKRGKETIIESQRKHKNKSIDDSIECIKKSIDDSVTKILEEIPANSVNEAKAQNQNRQEKRLEHDKGSHNGCPRRGKKKQEQLGDSKAQRRMKNQTADSVATKNDVQIPPTMSTSLGENIKTAINPPQESENLVIKNTTMIRCHTLGNNMLRKCENNKFQIQCAFCQSTNDTEDSGEMMHYFNGKPVTADFNGGVNVIHSHKNCTEWAPDVYFEDDMAINLAAEITRSRRIKCSCCGIKGAALGCFEKSCRKSFHFTCAKLISECRWDSENFVMLCPLHSSSKLPTETSEPQKQIRKRDAPIGVSQVSSLTKAGDDTSRMWTWPSGSPCKWVICCSALSVAEKDIISGFAKMTGVTAAKTWSPMVTHVIASTDKNGACKRTLKFLMAILDGKWILSIDWIKACMEAREPVDEEAYEITVDVHGISKGPQLGRLRIINKPKLFNGFSFYFSGEYTPSYKGYLQDLVIAAGGTVLQRKPISRDQEKLLDDSLTSPVFIIYSLEHPDKNRFQDYTLIFNHRRAEAQALADASGGKVVANTWIIDSIAACKLQTLS